MSLKLNLAAQTLTAAVAASGTTSGAFPVDGYSFGGVQCPASLTSTAMTFTVCDTLAGTYVALVDSSGNAISQTVAASKAFALPSALFSFKYAKLVCGSAEGAARDFVVTVKG